METLPDVLLASEIERAARNDMVDVPRTTVVLPRHATPELPLKIFTKLIEGAAQQHHALGRFNSAVLDASANSHPKSVSDAIVDAITSPPAFLSLASPNTIAILAMPATIVSAKFLGIALSPSVNDVPLLDIIFALLVEYALSIETVVSVLFLALELNIPGTFLGV
jgi:hypothetical protein